ncbi:preprotein translocase subunit SecA, partial [Xanthomonas citri pv. citri]|nr:preprotein translocase subunit SecA [Xanthomonas citri pv. citri]
NHIDTMDKLRSHTNLVQYAQKNPYQVYTQEGSKKFDEMLSNIAYDAMTEIFKDRLGAESLITSEMENDPIFRQLVDNIILDDMPDDEREELIV